MAKTRTAQTGLGATPTSYSTGGEDEACRRMTHEQRKRGGQPGNQNALKHGQRTREAQRERKLAYARIKALQHLLISQGMIPCKEGRLRPRPIRQDQMALLREDEPLLAALTSLRGLFLPDAPIRRRRTE